jgi:protein-S-isoprenylcysteine O-methyltransferase Ste14
MASRAVSVMVSLLFTVFGGPGILLVLVPWWITRFQIPEGQSAWRMIAGAVLIAAGLVPLLESIWRFIVVGRGTLIPLVPTERLVVTGLYRYVRNPMYVGVVTAIAGEALLFWNRSLVVELALVAVAMDLFVHFYEEPQLTRTYPAEYPKYSRNVRRWIPRLTAWDEGKPR